MHKIHSQRIDHPTQKPLELVDRMVLASCPKGGLVLDSFMDCGTTAVSAKRNGRNYVGFELNSEYCAISEQRLAEPCNINIDLELT